MMRLLHVYILLTYLQNRPQVVPLLRSFHRGSTRLAQQTGLRVGLDTLIKVSTKWVFNLFGQCLWQFNQYVVHLILKSVLFQPNPHERKNYALCSPVRAVA